MMDIFNNLLLGFSVAVTPLRDHVLGGVARMRDEPRRAEDELRFALAGPAVTLALLAVIGGAFSGESKATMPIYEAAGLVVRTADPADRRASSGRPPVTPSAGAIRAPAVSRECRGRHRTPFS